MDGLQQSAAPDLPFRSRNRGLGSTLIVSILCFACYATFFRHPIPVHPDEAEFMEGIGFPDHYPVHHPGYPLWVLMGTAGRALGLPAYEAFLVWSLGAAVVATALCHRLFRMFMSNRTALLFAAAFGLNPLMWYSSVTAMTYCMATAFGLGVVLLSAKSVVENRPRLVLWGAVILANGLFVRADLLMYVGPVLLLAVIRHRSFLLGLRMSAIVVTGCAAFLLSIPAMYGRGDPLEVAARAAHTQDVLLGGSVFRAGWVDGLARNVVKIVVDLGWPLGVTLPLFLWLSVSVLRSGRRGNFEFSLVCVWLLPGLVFLACFHVAQGYFLVLLPAFYLAVGVAIERGWRPIYARRIGGALVVLTVVQFLAYPWSSSSNGWKRTFDAKIGYLSRLGLVQSDERARIHDDGDFWRTPAHDLSGSIEEP